MKTSVLNHFIILFALVFSLVKANNINVTNIALVNQNTTAGLNNAANHTFVQFDLTWDNSWRNSAGPANWDAAWVFVKFQVFGSPEWLHATLSPTDANHSITNNNGVSMNIDAAANGRGVMVHRTNNGNGSLNLQGVRLRWDYRSGNTVHDTANVTVRVFAIEMVYIPEGEFFVGDGTLTTPAPSSNAFRINNVGNNRPYKVVNESALTLILNNATGGGANQIFDPMVSTTSVGTWQVPNAFPKGFAAFYVAKYELTVKQYVDFFNTLRTDITTAKNNRNISGSQPTRSTFTWNASPLTDATTGTTSGDRAQGGFSIDDALTYADWAGLRIMTDLEYEKVCRGTDRTGASPGIAVYPVNGEFAWGENVNNVNITTPTSGDGTASESIATTSTMNVNNNFASGPVRVGIFAAKNPTSNQRRLTGSTYYGVMEMTGNLEEYVYYTTNNNTFIQSNCTGTISDIFDGRHGDGNINSSTGIHNTFQTSCYYAPFVKGGSYSSSWSVSLRSGPSTCTCPTFTTRTATRGFRGAVSANQF
jgi:formylglycine-generating enzyme required for sulfatase activity